MIAERPKDSIVSSKRACVELGTIGKKRTKQSGFSIAVRETMALEIWA